MLEYTLRRSAIAIIALGLLTQAARAEYEFDVIRNLVYAERDSGALKTDIYIPRGDGPFPAMLVVHGGAWSTGTRAQLAGFAMGLAKLGYTSAAISYRLAPQQTFPAQIYDCQAAVRWLRTHSDEYKVDPNRIGGFGYSAGGHLVALLGALDDDDVREDGVPKDAPSARLQVVVAGGAPCDFRPLPSDSSRLAYWLGGTPGEKPDVYLQASPANFVTPDDPPMFFFHGSKDHLVPIRSPRKMVTLLHDAGVPAEFYEVAGAGHMAALIDGVAIQQATAFMERYMNQQATDDGD